MALITFTATQKVATAPAQAWAWHADPRNLARVCPPWMRVRHIEAELPAHPGARFTVALALLGIPLVWQGEWLRVEPPRLLVDRALRSPFAAWHHEHHFEPFGTGTLITDRVTLQWPAPLKWLPGTALLTRLQLSLLWAARKPRIAACLGPA